MKKKSRFLDLISKTIVCWLWTLPCLGFASSAHKAPLFVSYTYSGVLTKKNQKYTLNLANNSTKYNLLFNSQITEKVIQRLGNGDFVSVQAEVISSNSPIQNLNILSLNFVGLQLLLGTWRGNDNVCYHFKNFTSFLIFNTNSKGLCLVPSEPFKSPNIRKMSYFVNPDIQDWFLLISDKTTQYAAELLIKSPQIIQFNLFDQENGNILSKVILRR